MKDISLRPESRAVVAAVALLLLAGCSPFKPSPRQAMPTPLPKTFTMYTDHDPDPGKWWEEFGNEELDSFVEQALSENFSVQAAWAKLRQARASAIQAGADKYPTLNGVADYSHQRNGKGDSSVSTTEEHAIGLKAGYELDLWGKIEASAMSGDLDLAATREDLSTAAMTVAGEVASKWIQIQAQRRKKIILKEQIKANQTYLELIELRFRNSLATALDVYQQRENVAQVKAELPPVESEEKILLHELAALLGRPAGSVEVADASLPEVPETPGLGLPADLLANRPDVRSAGLKLNSADWSVTAARADRLPSVNLSGSALYTGAQLATMFNTWMFSLAGSVVGPILDGGYRAAEVEKARGVVDQRLAEYKEAVITAFKEVEDALSREEWQKKYITARKTQLEAARTNLKEASSRYIQGLDTYLPVLTALFSVQNLELSEVQDYADLLLYRVALYRALGGDWTDRLAAPQAPASISAEKTTPETENKG